MKRLFLALAVMALIAGGCLFAPANAAAKIYHGTTYVAGEGGHFAVFDMTINPANTQDPITVSNLRRIVIGTWRGHAVHDPRIGLHGNTMYWATILKDPKGYLHIGKINLKTGKVIMDKAIKPDPRATANLINYCDSGQTKKYYLPNTMAYEGYVDVRNKSNLKLVRRVFLTPMIGKDKYIFAHGTNSPDMKKFFVIASGATTPGSMKTLKFTGSPLLYMVKMGPMVNHGKLDVIAKNVLPGTPGETIPFRQNFTPNGKYIVQSGGDRFWVLDAKTLKIHDMQMMGAAPKNIPQATYPVVVRSVAGGQNHDAIATPDSKYALLTVRVPLMNGKKPITDGVVQLYDIQNKKFIGRPVSVCDQCHFKYGKYMRFDAGLCGINVNWKK